MLCVIVALCKCVIAQNVIQSSNITFMVVTVHLAGCICKWRFETKLLEFCSKSKAVLKIALYIFLKFNGDTFTNVC